jgi:hypothetical protein
MLIEAKPLHPADTDNNDDDTATYLEPDTQRTVGIPRAAAAAAILQLLCRRKAEKKERERQRESKMNQKKGKEKKHKKQMLRKTTKRRKQLVDKIAAVVVIRDPAEFCFARLFATRLLPLVPASLAPSLPAWAMVEPCTIIRTIPATVQYPIFNTRHCIIVKITFGFWFWIFFKLEFFVGEGYNQVFLFFKFFYIQNFFNCPPPPPPPPPKKKN